MTNKTAERHWKTTTLRTLLAALALPVLLAAGCSTGGEEAGPGAQERESAATGSSAEGAWPVAEVARKIEPSVVQVNVSSIQTSPYGPREARGLGSGVIYREDGYIVTNNHVVAGADTVNVAFADGSVEKGRVVGGDPYTDIAVVKVDRGNLPAAQFGDSRNLIVGQLAVAAGIEPGVCSPVSP
jgi:serine protease Do